MQSGATSRWIWMAILAVALGVRVVAAVWWQERLGDPHALVFPDSYSYWDLGQRIATGRPYEYGGPDFRVFRAPGYPVILAAYFGVAGQDPPVMGARILGAFLGTVAVAGVICLARLLFGDVTSWWAGALAAVYPGAVAASVLVLAESLFCPLMVWQLVGWVCAWQATTHRREAVWAGMAGVAGGLATLARPSWLLFTPLVLVCFLVADRQRRRHAVLGVWMLVAMALTLSPWWIRNYVVVGHFVPTTLQVGASLYDGWNPAATGGSNMEFAAAFYRAQKEEDAAQGRSPAGFEVRLDRRLHQAAVHWARDNPTAVLRLMGSKFLRMWNPWPNAQELRSGAIRWTVAIGFLPVWLLGLVGLWNWGRRGAMVVLCVFPALYFTGLHVIFASSIRYREPAMLIWIVLAAAVLARWGSRLGRAGGAAAADGGP